MEVVVEDGINYERLRLCAGVGGIAAECGTEHIFIGINSRCCRSSLRSLIGIKYEYNVKKVDSKVIFNRAKHENGCGGNRVRCHIRFE